MRVASSSFITQGQEHDDAAREQAPSTRSACDSGGRREVLTPAQLRAAAGALHVQLMQQEREQQQQQQLTQHSMSRASAACNRALLLHDAAEPHVPSSSALHAVISEPSREEQEALRLLANSKKQLEALQRDAPTTGALDWKRKHEQALAAMQRLVQELEAATAQQQQLRGRHRLVQMELALAERERQWLRARGPRVMPPAGGEYPASCGAIVSVMQLPSESQWDTSWDARVRGLKTLDLLLLLLLHKQWLQRCALKLPRIQLLHSRPESAHAEQEIGELYDRYNHFTQRAMRLAPESWQQTIGFDLDTLAQPPTTAFMQRFWQTNNAEAFQKIQQVRVHYQRIFANLRGEEQQLQQRYALLSAPASAGGSGLHDGGGGSTCSIVERVVVNAEADELLKRIEANLLQQELQRRNLAHAINYAVPIHEIMTIKVMLYPLAVNGQVLLD